MMNRTARIATLSILTLLIAVAGCRHTKKVYVEHDDHRWDHHDDHDNWDHHHDHDDDNH